MCYGQEVVGPEGGVITYSLRRNIFAVSLDTSHHGFSQCNK